MEDIRDLSTALDDIADSPQYVLDNISADLMVAGERLETLKVNLSEELKEQLLKERIDATRKTLQLNLNNAENDLSDLERQLQILKDPTQIDVSNALANMIAEAEARINSIKAHRLACVANIKTALTTSGEDQLDRLISSLKEFDVMKEQPTDEHSVDVYARATKLMLRLAELKELVRSSFLFSLFLHFFNSFCRVFINTNLFSFSRFFVKSPFFFFSPFFFSLSWSLSLFFSLSFSLTTEKFVAQTNLE